MPPTNYSLQLRRCLSGCLSGGATLTKFWHAGLVVSDLQRSIEFYTEGLGLNLIAAPEVAGPGVSRLVGYEKAHLKEAFLGVAEQRTVMGCPTLVLIQYVNPQGSEKITEERNAIGAGHVAFFINELDELFERLVEMGARPLDEPAPINETMRGCYLTDPDGNWIELVELI